MDQKRIFYFDIIRIIACLMVILMHTPSPTSGLDGISYHILDMLAEPCIGLFYMVSGALLLPVKMPYREFLKKRLNKVVWPTIIFSFIVLLLALAYKEISLQTFVKQVFSIPFSTYKSGVLWFMYPLIGMYLLAPVISPFLEKASKYEILLLLCFWIVTLCWNPLQLLFNVDTSEESMLHVFSGYTGYFVLGYYLNKYPVRIKAYIFPFLIFIPWGMDACNKVLGWGLSKYDFFWYLSIFCVMQCIAWFQLVKQYCPPQSGIAEIHQRLIVNFSNCSFGIYLVHRIIIQRILWNIDALSILHPYIRVFLIFSFTVFLSWILINLISRIRFSKYIIGI